MQESFYTPRSQKSPPFSLHISRDIVRVPVNAIIVGNTARHARVSFYFMKARRVKKDVSLMD